MDRDDAQPPRLGLGRGAVQLVDHQPGWAEVFERERLLLRGRLGKLACDIQHVGSTAVPGLAAKPIIDIAVAIPSLSVLPDVRTSLVALGYLDRGDFAADGGHLFVRESAPDVRTHHVHVVRVDDPQWRNYLAFRDGLRSDPRARAEYGALKLGLGERVAHDRRAYVAVKVACIRRILGLG